MARIRAAGTEGIALCRVILSAQRCRGARLV